MIELDDVDELATESDGSGWANVVAIDPGGTTGWSVMMVHPDSLAVPDVSILGNLEHWSHGEVHGDEDSQARQILELIECWPDAAVVIEDFILRSQIKDRELLSPVRVTAKIEFGLKWWPGLSGFRKGLPVFKQPTSVLASMHDGRMRSWGLYQAEGGMKHARDADRHAIYFLRDCKTGRESKERRESAWPDLYKPDEEEEE